MSNFFGGVECAYMKDRFHDHEVKELLQSFEAVDLSTFQRYLKQLQPNRKRWTEAQLMYWTKRGEPIRGVLSQLVGASVRNTPTGKQRRKIVQSMANLKGELHVNAELSNKEKQQLMLRLLRKKFAQPYYRRVLLSTKDAVLHERPMRGQPNMWTYKNGQGGDCLGKLLMQVREEL